MPTGLADLLGSIPGALPLRILRLERLRRVVRDLRGREPGEVLEDFLARRASVAPYLVAIASILVMLIGSSLMAFIEPPAPGSNIKTGGDASGGRSSRSRTVGYGDHSPSPRRPGLSGCLTMATGIGIFSVLTSFLAHAFLRLPGRRLDAAAGRAGVAAEEPIPAAFTGSRSPTTPPARRPTAPRRAPRAALRDRGPAAADRGDRGGKPPPPPGRLTGSATATRPTAIPIAKLARPIWMARRRSARLAAASTTR